MINIIKIKCVDQIFGLSFNTRKKDYHKVAKRKWEKWLARIKGRDSNEEDMDISSIKVTFPHLAYMIKLEKELKRLNQMLVDSLIHNLEKYKNEGREEGLIMKEESYPKYNVTPSNYEYTGGCSTFWGVCANICWGRIAL